jgi:hypothetical protein
MFDFGRYVLSYQPPEGAVEADVSMSISSEADLTQMLRFFESFLQAAGYEFEGKELCLERTAPDFDSKEYWSDKFFRLLYSEEPEDEVLEN